MPVLRPRRSLFEHKTTAVTRSEHGLSEVNHSKASRGTKLSTIPQKGFGKNCSKTSVASCICKEK
jgi:hypothetical protein